MAPTTYFDEELTRLRKLWLHAVLIHDTEAAQDASTAYFLRAQRLRAKAWAPSTSFSTSERSQRAELANA